MTASFRSAFSTGILAGGVAFAFFVDQGLLVDLADRGLGQLGAEFIEFPASRCAGGIQELVQFLGGQLASAFSCEITAFHGHAAQIGIVDAEDRAFRRTAGC